MIRIAIMLMVNNAGYQQLEALEKFITVIREDNNYEGAGYQNLRRSVNDDYKSIAMATARSPRGRITQTYTISEVEYLKKGGKLGVIATIYVDLPDANETVFTVQWGELTMELSSTNNNTDIIYDELLPRNVTDRSRPYSVKVSHELCHMSAMAYGVMYYQH